MGLFNGWYEEKQEILKTVNENVLFKITQERKNLDSSLMSFLKESREHKEIVSDRLLKTLKYLEELGQEIQKQHKVFITSQQQTLDKLQKEHSEALEDIKSIQECIKERMAAIEEQFKEINLIWKLPDI